MLKQSRLHLHNKELLLNLLPFQGLHDPPAVKGRQRNIHPIQLLAWQPRGECICSLEYHVATASKYLQILSAHSIVMLSASPSQLAKRADWEAGPRRLSATSS